jgi:polyribonucleotide nucleotidyltransferase
MEVVLFEIDSEIEKAVRELCEKEMNEAIQVQEKHAREDAINAVKEKVLTNMKNKKRMKKRLNKFIMF